MLSQSRSVGTGSRVLITAASLVIVLAGMKAAQQLLVPLVFAAFVALLTAPAVLGLRSRRVPSSLAVGIVVIGIIVVLGGLATILGGSVNAFAAAVPSYQKHLNEALVDYSSALEGYGIAVSTESLKQLLNPAALLDFAGDLLSQLASLLSDTLLILLTVGFMLLEVASFPRKLRAALGDPNADLSAYTGLNTEVKRYVVIKSYLSAATGVLIGSFVGIMGIDFPVLWGLVAFLLNYVPNIGSIVAAVPPILLALVQFGPGAAIGTLAGYVVVNGVIGNMLEPRLLGRKLGLSSLVVFVSLVFWGWLWGPLGMLLSVPLTMIVKILLESSEQFGSVAVLLDQPLSQRAAFSKPFEHPSAETPPGTDALAPSVMDRSEL